MFMLNITDPHPKVLDRHTAVASDQEARRGHMDAELAAAAQQSAAAAASGAAVGMLEGAFTAAHRKLCFQVGRFFLNNLNSRDRSNGIAPSLLTVPFVYLTRLLSKRPGGRPVCDALGRRGARGAGRAGLRCGAIGIPTGKIPSVCAHRFALHPHPRPRASAPGEEVKRGVICLLRAFGLVVTHFSAQRS